MKYTRSTPIVFLTVTDPLGQGLVASLAHPGGNITGFSVFEFSLGSKWLETLKLIAPGPSTGSPLFFNPVTAPYYELYLKAISAAVPSLAVRSIALPQSIVKLTSRTPSARSVASRTATLFVLPDSHNVVYRKKIIELAAHYRLPTIYYFRYFASDGGLISYGPDEMDLFRRTAGYVDRILRGTNPSDLPVQQPTKIRTGNKSQNCQGNGDTYPGGIP